jgi:hypothetical protein
MILGPVCSMHVIYESHPVNLQAIRHTYTSEYEHKKKDRPTVVNSFARSADADSSRWVNNGLGVSNPIPVTDASISNVCGDDRKSSPVMANK